jgi:hypothetical protein
MPNDHSMRFVIDAQGIKRELSGPFSIATSRADLEALIWRLRRAAVAWDFEGVSYGWVEVAELIRAEGEPLPWRMVNEPERP